MKNALFSLLGLAAIFMVAACGSETKPTDATGTPTVAVTTADGELWGEHVRSQAEIIKPEDWDSSDWVRVNKFVDQQKIASTIMDAVLSGKQKAYDPFDENVEISVETLNSQMHKTDTLLIEDPAKPGVIEQKIIKREFSTESITNIRFIEDWYFDKVKFKLTKKVTGIVLGQSVLNDDGSFKGLKPIILVKLNN